MNYGKIYNQLIERSSEVRSLDYGEWHHIIPKCVGGTDDASNLVFLTAREHFIAHALLVKIYENDGNSYKLASAFNYMCSDSHRGKRYNSRSFQLARKLFSKNHPCKDDKIKEKIKISLNSHYSEIVETYGREALYRVPRETRYCGCGCGESFEVKTTDSKKYVKNHANRVLYNDETKSKKISDGMKSYVEKLTEEELKNRLSKSLWKADQKLRGESISRSKKGKKTNQQEIMGVKYAKLNDHEFFEYIKNRPERIQKRMTNLRNKYANNDD